jgi:hypothetical protein
MHFLKRPWLGLQRFLVAANDVKTPQGRAPFAFKLHQFISGPGKVLATLEASWRAAHHAGCPALCTWPARGGRAAVPGALLP